MRTMPPTEPDPLEGAVPVPDGPLPQGLPTYKTKFDAFAYGAKLGALAWLATAISVSLAIVLARRQGFDWTNWRVIEPFLQTAWIALGVSTLLSGYMGFETHRLATGDRRFVLVPWWQWLLPMLCCYPFIPLWFACWLQSYIRRTMFIMRNEPSYGWCWIYVGLAGIGVLICADSIRGDREAWSLAFCIMNLLLFFAADCLMVYQVAKWGKAVELAPRYAKFQFTLGHMVKVIFLGGFYLTVFLKLVHLI